MKVEVVFSLCCFLCFFGGIDASAGDRESRARPDLVDRRITQLTGWTCDGERVDVPHTWNALDGADGPCGVDQDKDNSVAGRAFLRCSKTYCTTLPAANEGRRYFVRCDGAAVRASVAVNGRLAGIHRGAVTAFAFEVTKFMRRNAENRLEIVVDNFFDELEPPVYGDYTLEGGLYRPVWLIETDPVCIDPTVYGGPGVEISTDPSSGEIRVKAAVSGAEKYELELSVGGKTAKGGAIRVEHPELWSPENPRLYDLAVTVRAGDSVDTVHQQVGFRTAEFRDDGFYLNGVKRKLRGVNYHQEREGLGWALTEKEIAEDLDLIKAMGADAMRGTHYPHSRTCYDLCDRKGLLCWVEIPASSLVHTNALYRERLRETTREIVAQNRNHPSLLMWSLFNELYSVWDGHVMPAGTGETVVRELQDLVHGLDPAHPTVCASAYIDRTELNGITDLYAFNTYPGWYWSGRNSKSDDIPDLIARQVATSGCGKKTIGIGEYGGGSSVFHHENPLVNRPVPRSRFHPEEAETEIHVTEYGHIRRDARLWGSFIWMMFDAASDNRNEGDHDGINDKGLVTHDHKTPKDAYFFYKANWNPEPMVHVCSKRMTTTEGDRVTVRGFSNAGEVALVVNGVRIGAQAPDEVRTVCWKDVPVSAGDNRIELQAGGLTDVWTLTRRTPGCTAGWENLPDVAREFPETDVVWRFSDLRDGDWRVELREGAAGVVEIRDGTVSVLKTNDVGKIVITAKPFAAEKGRELAFAADVEVDGTDWSVAKGRLCAYGEKESFKVCKLDEVDGRWGNRCIMWELPNSAPGTTYRKYTQHVSEGQVTPVILISGGPSRSVWRNWLAEDRQHQRAAWQKERDRRNAVNRFKERVIDRETFEKALAADVDHTAKVCAVDGVSTLFVDGKRAVPLVYRGKHSTLGVSQTELFFGRRLQDQGLKLQIVDVRFGPCGGDMGFWTKDGFDLNGMVNDIETAMRISPDAVFMLALGCTVYPEFVEEENPDEVWLTEEGTKVIGHGSSAIKYVDKSINAGNRKWEWPSMASRKYRDGICDRIRELIAELKRKGLTKRIVGVHIFGYHDAQFTMALSDHSKHAKAEYLKYLAEGGHASTNYEFFVRQLGFRAQEEFARTFKRELGKDAIAAMWWESPLRGRPASSWNLGEFLRSDVMDVIVAQPWYEHRNPAIIGGSHPPFASMHLHGKMFWDELDLRTYEIIEGFRGGPASIPGGGVSADLSMWRTIFRKLSGVAIANDMGDWFYEKAGGGFSTPTISADIGEQYRLWSDVLSRPRRAWRPSVAIVADEAGVWGWPDGERFDWPAVERSYFDQLPLLEASGVPFDIYLLEDALRKPEILAGYRLVLFAHLRKVDPERKRLLDRLGADGKRLVFLGGAGELGGLEDLPSRPFAPGGLTAVEFNRLTCESGGYAAMEPNAAQVEMNGRFVSVHALKNGSFAFELPFPAEVTNLKTGVIEPMSEGRIRLTLTAGETCYFALKGVQK